MKSHCATPCDASSVPGASYMLTKQENKVSLKHNWLTAGGKYFLHPNHKRPAKKKYKWSSEKQGSLLPFNGYLSPQPHLVSVACKTKKLQSRAKVDQLISQPNKPPVPNSPCCNSFLRCSSKGSGLFLILRRRLIITRK
jgi:hypothetical protein